MFSNTPGDHYIPYSGKVWRGESLANRLRFAKLKPSKLVVTINSPLADVFIRQTFFRQTLEKSRFAKHSARQIFPLYGNYQSVISNSEISCYLISLVA